MNPNVKLVIFPFFAFTLVFNKNELKFFWAHWFFCFIIALIFSLLFATIDCVADEGVGPEDFEDPEDFV